MVEFRNVKFMQTLGCRKLSSSSFSPISPELKMPNYPILIWLDKFYVFLTGYNKIRRKRPGSKFKWRPHVASQPLAEVSTGGTLGRGGRPAMASNFHRLSLILRKSSRVRWGNSKIFETCLSIVINLETSVGLRIGIVVDILSKPKHKFFKRNLETYLMTKSGDKRGIPPPPWL